MRRASLCALATAAAALLAYAAYVEAGGPQEERIARARGCGACHASQEETLRPMLQTLRPGEALRPKLLSRLQAAHPLLSCGAEAELTDYLSRHALPALARHRAQDAGEALYLAKCAACHGRDGLGQPGDYPPLKGSEWLAEEPGRLPEILTDGLQGPINVKGAAWDKTMHAPKITDSALQQSLIEYMRARFSR